MNSPPPELVVPNAAGAHTRSCRAIPLPHDGAGRYRSEQPTDSNRHCLPEPTVDTAADTAHVVGRATADVVAAEAAAGIPKPPAAAAVVVGIPGKAAAADIPKPLANFENCN